jgi:hypothetical protein
MDNKKQDGPAVVHLSDLNSRILGVGERIGPGVFYRAAIQADVGTYLGYDDWTRVGTSDSVFGGVVTPEDDRDYRMFLGHDKFDTGAVRNKQAGKGRFDLIAYEGLLPLARRLEDGAVVYGDRNWEKGMPLSRFLSSLRRHAMQINYDFNEDHVGAVLFNAHGFAATVARLEAGLLPRELDDIGWLIQHDRENNS